MVPDFETLMRPVLSAGKNVEVAISDVVKTISDEFDLTEDERNEILPSGKQTRIANRVHWAKSYLKQAGLVKNTRRGYYKITEQGKTALSSNEHIDKNYLEQFDAYQEFKSRTSTIESPESPKNISDEDSTPDELLRQAHNQIKSSLISDLIERIREAEPYFFESLIVDLLLAMGYGATGESGQILGQSGDNGVDGVINQDTLGVDQVYVQAKRYAADNKIGSGAIRDFYGALGLKDVTKGIFVTTSSFSESAKTTAEKLGARIILIDGIKLAQLLIEYSVGCQVEATFSISKIDENYFG